MICEIADLLVEIPAAGDMISRCREYLSENGGKADVVIHKDLYSDRYSNEDITLREYMESGYQFYLNLISFHGLYLHAAAVVQNNRAYLFSGRSGVGKSTHGRLWKEHFGESICIMNDDKPAVRYVDGKWYCYGTPWCGKDGINQNKKVPVAGICFLKQASSNRIRPLSGQEAISCVLSQTIHNGLETRRLMELLDTVDRLICDIPIFELENRPELEAARLSYETMRRAAEEAGL